jgi:hypothetical protein
MPPPPQKKISGRGAAASKEEALPSVGGQTLGNLLEPPPVADDVGLKPAAAVGSEPRRRAGAEHQQRAAAAGEGQVLTRNGQTMAMTNQCTRRIEISGKRQ